MKREKLTFPQVMAKLRRAGVENSPTINSDQPDLTAIDSIDDRVKKLIGIINQKERDSTNMLFFVMYDIESNKVRHQVAKYLIKRGCFRIQRSIFLADLTPDTYNQIKSDLVEVQACYENEDSILITPISTDTLNSMKIIGKNIDIDVITRSKNTLFF